MGTVQRRSIRAIVISQPKAGTYLLANLLQEFDLVFTHMHIRETRYEVYHSTEALDYTQYISSLEDSVGKILEGEFAVSHIFCTENNRDLLKDFKKIVLTRNEEDRIKSHLHWKKKKRDAYNTESYERRARLIPEWLEYSGTFHLTFSDMKNFNENKIDNLQKFLFNDILFDSAWSVRNSLTKDSLTKRDHNV